MPRRFKCQNTQAPSAKNHCMSGAEKPPSGTHRLLKGIGLTKIGPRQPKRLTHASYSYLKW